MQEYLSNFQKIHTNFFSIGEKVEEKTRALVLLASLLPFFESLMSAFLVKKSTIKMDEVTMVLLQNEILRRKNRASSSDGDSTLTMTGGSGGRRQSGRRSQSGRSRSKSRDSSKIRYYRCDELEHRVRDYPQLRDWTKAAVAMAGSDTKKVMIFF